MYLLKDIVKTRKQGAGYSLHIRHLDIRRGDRLAITGPSGCGKSTMLDIAGLVLKPDSWETFLFQPEEKKLDMGQLWEKNLLDDMAALRLKHMGYILQTGGLLPFLSVEENMGLTAKMCGKKNWRERVRELAEELGILRLLSAMPGTLSVGERQRVAIVRALASDPDLILADEPTAALDPVHAGQVLDIFLNMVKKQGCALVMVTHNADFAASRGLKEVSMQLHHEGDAVRAVLDDRETPHLLSNDGDPSHSVSDAHESSGLMFDAHESSRTDLDDRESSRAVLADRESSRAVLDNLSSRAELDDRETSYAERDNLSSCEKLADRESTRVVQDAQSSGTESDDRGFSGDREMSGTPKNSGGK